MADAAALDDHAVYLPGAVCPAADWSLFRVQSPDNPNVVRMNETSAVNGTGFATDTRVEFSPGATGTDTQIELRFTASTILGPQSIVKLNLPGCATRRGPSASARTRRSRASTSGPTAPCSAARRATTR